MLGMLIAILSGALMSIQGVFNTGVTKQTNIWLSSCFVQITAFIVCMAGWIIAGREASVSSLFKIDNKYMLLGGAIGAFITFTVVVAMGNLGPAKATMLIVTSQLITSYLVELFGMFGTEKVEFEFRKLIGVIIIIAGILIFKWEVE
ncbi:MAG: DMT family transporter [Clostridiales bacterium]|nr:DMT family transporter [Clostridiales bacterium]